MKKLIFTIFLGMAINLALQAQKNRIVKVCDEVSGQTLIGVNIVSIDSKNQGLVSDLNGNAEFSQFENDEIVMFTYVGYESALISIQELSKHDTIYLKEGPAGMTLGSTGILPSMTLNVYIPENCRLRQEDYDEAILQEERERLVDEFIKDLKASCKSGCQNVVVNFNIDDGGNLVDFKILNFEFSRSKSKIKSILSVGKGLLRESRCFGLMINGNEKHTGKSRNYHVILS